MFAPKCYTIINKLYEPKKDIRNVRNKLNEWNDHLDDMITDLEEFNKVFGIIYLYIERTHFPDIDIPFYKETMEGWKLIKERNRLKKEYPRQYREVLAENPLFPLLKKVEQKVLEPTDNELQPTV